MKEAVGELNMTVVTVVIIAALAGIGVLIAPMIGSGIRNASCEATLGEGAVYTDGWCCPAGVTAGGSGCTPVDEP